MSLEHLEAHQFRNFTSLEIQLDPGLQVIYGDNASGKTSILEAIHTLCSGKSFLGASPRKMLQIDQNAFSLSGRIVQPSSPKHILQYRWQDQHIDLKIGYESARRTSEYAAIQPAQAISPQSYRLIEETPDLRRRFLDWGVFHVKQDYSATWRQFQRSLTQRNAMLAQGTDSRSLEAWSREYIQLANRLDQYRQQYIDAFIPALQSLTAVLFPGQEVELHYAAGWDREKGLESLLQESFSKDIERKFTYYGPQRADLTIKLCGTPARDTASRGQKKLLTFALYLAQAHLQQQTGHKEGLLLIDDLPSELDRGHLGLVSDILVNLPMQVIISCIDPGQLAIPDKFIKKRFHVKQGQAAEVV